MKRLFLVAGLCLALGGAAAAGENRPLLVVSARTGNPDVFSIDLATGDAKNLTNHPAKDTMPAWSPDGKKIAFSSDRDGANNVFVMDADGSNVRQLTHEKAGVTCSIPTWSPDGSQIAYCRVENNGSAIWVANADGSGAFFLAADTWDPAWSPDGTKIAFTTDRTKQGFRLAVMDADGTHVRELVAADNPAGHTYPAWSPDGTRLAFTDLVAGAWNCS